jgi:hypothetical protein
LKKTHHKKIGLEEWLKRSSNSTIATKQNKTKQKTQNLS